MAQPRMASAGGRAEATPAPQVSPRTILRPVVPAGGYDDRVPAGYIARHSDPYHRTMMSTTIDGSVGPVVSYPSRDPHIVWAPRTPSAEALLSTFLSTPIREPDPRVFAMLDKMMSLAMASRSGGGGGSRGSNSTSTKQGTIKEGSAEQKPIIGESIPSHGPAAPGAMLLGPVSSHSAPAPGATLGPVSSHAGPAPVYGPLTEGNTSGIAAVERSRNGGPKVGAEPDPVIEGDTSGTAAVERNRDGGPSARTRFHVGSPGIPGEGAATGVAAVDRNVPHVFTRITPDPLPLSPSSSLAEASRIVEEMRGAPGTTPSRIRGAAPTSLPPVFFGPKEPLPPAPAPIIPMKPPVPLPSHPTARFRVGMPGIPGEGAASGLGSVYHNTRKQPR